MFAIAVMALAVTTTHLTPPPPPPSRAHHHNVTSPQPHSAEAPDAWYMMEYGTVPATSEVQTLVNQLGPSTVEPYDVAATYMYECVETIETGTPPNESAPWQPELYELFQIGKSDWYSGPTESGTDSVNVPSGKRHVLKVRIDTTETLAVWGYTSTPIYRVKRSLLDRSSVLYYRGLLDE